MLWNIQPFLYVGSSVIEDRLGYVFAAKEKLYEAITHRSALVGVPGVGDEVLAERPWNERLEFLGDSVLGLVISDALLASSHGLSEGEMSRIRASIVCEANLARIARERLMLPGILVLGASEKASGGRDKVSLLADALEAILGAVFSDRGWDAARHVTRTLFSDELSGDVRRFLAADAKTIFQELAQEKLHVTPTYAVIAEAGPAHQRTFEVVAKLGEDEWGRGIGFSKKDAAQVAARFALERIRGISP